MDARDRIIDAYATLLIDGGDRAATLDAVAAAAGVSKGGLLYHFPNGDALVEALRERAVDLGQAMREGMVSAPEGPARRYLTSTLDVGTGLGRALLALARVAHGAHPHAIEALRADRQQCVDIIDAELGDPALSEFVVALGDGLHYAGLLGTAETVELRDRTAAVGVRALELLQEDAPAPQESPEQG